MRKDTEALAIFKEVKQKVAERDSYDGWPCCVACGLPAPSTNRLAFSCAHYIGRAQGGLGIEENILTLCPACHKRYDQTEEREEMRKYFEQYLTAKYGRDWNKEKLVYRKCRPE